MRSNLWEDIFVVTETFIAYMRTRTAYCCLSACPYSIKQVNSTIGTNNEQPLPDELTINGIIFVKKGSIKE